MWDTIIPSEFGFTYFLSKNGSCELQYASPYSEWVVKNCNWIVDHDQLTITFKNEKVKYLYFGEEKESSSNSPEITFFDFKGRTIKYIVDKDYINVYMNNLYSHNCKYNIKGVLTMKPVGNSDCKEEWCMQPYFKITKGSLLKSLHEIDEKYPCR